MDPFKSDDYLHGYRSGQESLDKSVYEGYISNEATLEWLEEQLNAKTQDLEELETKIAEQNLSQQSQYAALQTEDGLLRNLQFQFDKIKQNISKAEAKIEELTEYRKSLSTPYSFMAGVLYLIAGFAFVFGDLIISHEIVAYALNIHNTTEAWAFAFGLAMLSVLLKPAYERLVEYPYLQGKGQRLYSIFQGILLSFALGTMFILGWFRYESYKTDRLKDAINKEMRSIQNAGTSIDATSGTAQQNLNTLNALDQKIKEMGALNLELVNSPWALASFVLSGLLFAVAGAICLGIAFPILQVYIRRWLQIGPLIGQQKKSIKKWSKEEISLAEQLHNQEVKTAVEQNKLQAQTPLPDLLMERKKLIEILDGLFETIKTIRIERRISNFNDGYELGKTISADMTDDEIVEARKMALENMKQKNQENSEAKKLAKSGLRPHLALRKEISGGLN